MSHSYSDDAFFGDVRDATHKVTESGCNQGKASTGTTRGSEMHLQQRDNLLHEPMIVFDLSPELRAYRDSDAMLEAQRITVANAVIRQTGERANRCRKRSRHWAKSLRDELSSA